MYSQLQWLYSTRRAAVSWKVKINYELETVVLYMVSSRTFTRQQFYPLFPACEWGMLAIPYSEGHWYSILRDRPVPI